MYMIWLPVGQPSLLFGRISGLGSMGVDWEEGEACAESIN